MTPYSAAAEGRRESRSSSRRAARSASSGSAASSSWRRSSASSAWSASPSPSSSWIAFSCWRRKYSRCERLHLRLHLRLDLRAELEGLELSAEDGRQTAQPRLDVRLLEQLLLLGDREAQRRGDQIGELAGRVDVRNRELELGGQVGREVDDPREDALYVLRERLHLRRLGHDVRDRFELAREVGLLLREPLQADAAETLDEHPNGPVGDPQHAMDDRRRPDGVDLLGAWCLDLGIFRDEEREHPVARHRVVDQLDRALLADRERAHRLREDDCLPQGQNGQKRRDLRFLAGLALERLALLGLLAHPCLTTAT